MSSLHQKLHKLEIQPVKDVPLPKVTPAEIATLESSIGYSLPADFKEVIVEYGESMFPHFVNCTPNSGPLYFGYFLSLSDIAKGHKHMRDYFPDSIIPIADDDCGNLFCLGLGPMNCGHVYFWAHDIGLPGGAYEMLVRGEVIPDDIKEQSLHRIATSFAEFVGNMTIDE